MEKRTPFRISIFLTTFGLALTLGTSLGPAILIACLVELLAGALIRATIDKRVSKTPQIVPGRIFTAPAPPSEE